MGYQTASLWVLWLVLAVSSAIDVVPGRIRNHGHYVCSTWGNYHFKTFDGDFYQFPGSCSYNLASDCKDSYQEFSVHVHRSMDSGHPLIDKIAITIKDVIIQLKGSIVVVNGAIAKTPYYSFGILIHKNDAYIKVYTKTGMTLMWNKEDALMLELDPKFNNHTCGLCGDYNGIPIYNEFLSGDITLSPVQFGNLQNIHDPNDDCTDSDETQKADTSQCSKYRTVCEEYLAQSAFSDCQSLLNVEPYIQACMLDMCSCDQAQDTFCLCSTITEYSRQCSHAGGRPGNWRSNKFCPKQCPANMIYQESASPCKNSCSHLEIHSLCEEHYMDGCFCPAGTVQDDYTNRGCVPVSECHCKHRGQLYKPGETIQNDCDECFCDSGRWNCTDRACPGVCSIEGGAHFTTFDGKAYTFHGNCYYVLSKGNRNDSHALLGELTPCSSIARETCLKSVILLTDNKKNVVTFKGDGSVLLNDLKITLPHVTASFTILQPSDSYIIAQVTNGLKILIQLLPMMQLYITMDKSARSRLQGLCGNFNSKEGDDFQTSGGLVEATASAFANTWKAQASCDDMTDWLDDPCSLSIENKNYADYWCSMLEKDGSRFSICHSAIDPTEYAKRCRYDSCVCKDSEVCMCAAVSSYVRACAAKGIIMWGWKNGICEKDITSCPSSQVYQYNLTTCQPTCRSLAEGEKACTSVFTPVDGCACPDGQYLNEKDQCVPISKCSCYYHGTYLDPLDVIYKQGERCSCHSGKLICSSHINDTCPEGKEYFDCNKVQSDVAASYSHRSCKTLSVEYFQTECVSGCVCPHGLLDDGAGGCVPEDKCPCVHNEDIFPHGTQVNVDCNTCLCQRGRWSCTNAICYGTCAIYGNGHYVTFDDKLYDFDGNCEFVAAQDYCGPNHSDGNFSIITENIPCGTTGVTCSKSIKVFLGNTVLKLAEKHLEETVGQGGKHVQYLTREVGAYLVIEASNGILLIWDRKTTIFIKVSPAYKGKLCGLCGNFDDNSQNDFTTSHMLQVTDVLEFGNSWKVDSNCPDATDVVNPCSQNPHRQSWSEKQCGLIKSQVFKVCHSKVDPKPFYEACVNDACSCDSGGDCECFCTAVAAYAQECTKAEACVYWRTPDICPIFCDYYNPKDECEWHYHPCGNHNIQTCRSINNVYTNITITYLEGCYPTCPKDKPIFDETKKKCVRPEECGCYIDNKHYEIGDDVPSDKKCHTCVCSTESELSCIYNQSACFCIINGTRYEEGEVISREEQSGVCIEVICVNGTEEVVINVCPTTIPTTTSTTIITTPTTTSLTTTVSTTVTLSSTTQQSTTCVYEEVCQWTQWFDVSKPGEDLDSGDYETYEEIRKHHSFCELPDQISQIQCRAVNAPDVSLDDLKQNVHCNVSYGLICRNSEQELDDNLWQKCFNYEIRVYCCSIECQHSTTATTTPSTTTTTTTPTTTTPTTTTPTTTTPTSPTSTVFSTVTTTPESTTATTTPTTTTVVTSTVTTTPESTTITPTTTPTGPSTVTTTPESTTATTTPTTTTATTIVTSTVTTTPESTTITPTTTPTVPSTVTTTPESTTTTTTPTTTSSPTTTTTIETRTPDCIPVCEWTEWFDVSYPTYGDDDGDFETYENIRNANHTFCEKPENISCRAQKFPDTPLADLGQKVTCDVSYGLVCNNKDQDGYFPMCLNYQITVYCCRPLPEYCISTTSTGPTTKSTTTTYTTTEPTTTSTTAQPTTTSPTTTSVTTTTQSTVTTTECTTETEETTPQTSTPETLTPPIKDTSPTTTTESATSVTTSPTTTTTEITTVIDTTTTTETTPTTTQTTTTTTHSTTPYVPSSTTTIITETTPETTSTTVTTAATTTPDCVPYCSWSEWFDVSYPKYEPNGGDYETYENIKNAGYDVCERPENISCRAQKFPDTPLADLGQKLTCDVSYGLICNNKDQEGFMPVCYNYEIKVYCCRPLPPHCLSSTTETTTATTTQSTTTSVTTTPTTTITTTATTPETFTPTITETPTTTTTESTTSVTTTPTTTITSTASSTTSTTAPTTTQTTATTTFSTTPYGPSSTTITTTETTSETTTITECIPDCSWSEWFDVSYPKYEPNGGDYETYENIKNAGHDVCEKPENISCRAQKFPDTPLADLGQKLTCDVSYGLICNNKDQDGFMPVCYNYEIKVYCCRPLPPHCLSSTTETTTATTTQSTTMSVTTTPTTTITTTATTEKTTTPETFTSTITETPTTTTTESTTSVTTSPTTTTTEIITVIDTTTTTETSPTTTQTTATTVHSETPYGPSSTTTTTTETTSETTTPSTTTTTPPTTTPDCVPDCSWSEWFDVSYPKYEPNGGDYETYENIKKAGHDVCEKPENIYCRAQKFPDTPLADLGQKLTCDVSYGLICNNKDQEGFMPVCYNYEIKVYCCLPLPPHCVSSTTETTTATTTQSTTTSVTTTPTTTITTTASTPETFTPTIIETPTTTTTESTTSVTTTPTTTITTTASTTTSETSPTTTQTTATTVHSETPYGPSSTTATTTETTSETTTPSTTTTTPPTTTPHCVPDCSWSEWFDVSYPKYEPNGGDYETYENIKNAGYDVCEKPENISCRAQKFPDTPLDDLGQKVTCDVSYGLICNNKDQEGFMPVCYNYEIKVYCCRPLPPHCLSSTTETTTATTTQSTTTSVTTTPTTTITTTATTPETFTPTITETPTTTTTESTTSVTTLPTTTTTETTPTTTSETSPTTTQTTATTVYSETPYGPSSTTTTTTETTSETTTPSTTKTTPPTTTPYCVPDCSWSDWYDVSYPKYEPDGGDYETYENIRNAGHDVCEKPENISCRAQKFPHSPLEDLGQKVTCDVSYGLICNNRDQEGFMPVCYNYEIKVYCCSLPPHCLSTTPLTTTTTHSTTTSVTTPTTTVTKTTTPESTTTPVITSTPETSTPTTTETTTTTTKSTTSVTISTEPTTSEPTTTSTTTQASTTSPTTTSVTTTTPPTTTTTECTTETEETTPLTTTKTTPETTSTPETSTPTTTETTTTTTESTTTATTPETSTPYTTVTTTTTTESTTTETTPETSTPYTTVTTTTPTESTTTVTTPETSTPTTTKTTTTTTESTTTQTTPETSTPYTTVTTTTTTESTTSVTTSPTTIFSEPPTIPTSSQTIPTTTKSTTPTTPSVTSPTTITTTAPTTTRRTRPTTSEHITIITPRPTSRTSITPQGQVSNTTVTPNTNATTKPSTTIPTTSKTPTPTTTSVTTTPLTTTTTETTISSSTTCVCVYSGTPYPPGIITDGVANGTWCYKVICSRVCKIHVHQWPCPLTTTPTTTTESTTTTKPTTTTPEVTTTPGSTTTTEGTTTPGTTTTTEITTTTGTTTTTQGTTTPGTTTTTEVTTTPGTTTTTEVTTTPGTTTTTEITTTPGTTTTTEGTTTPGTTTTTEVTTTPGTTTTTEVTTTPGTTTTTKATITPGTTTTTEVTTTPGTTTTTEVTTTPGTTTTTEVTTTPGTTTTTEVTTTPGTTTTTEGTTTPGTTTTTEVTTTPGTTTTTEITTTPGTTTTTEGTTTPGTTTTTEVTTTPGTTTTTEVTTTPGTTTTTKATITPGTTTTTEVTTTPGTTTTTEVTTTPGTTTTTEVTTTPGTTTTTEVTTTPGTTTTTEGTTTPGTTTTTEVTTTPGTTTTTEVTTTPGTTTTTEVTTTPGTTTTTEVTTTPGTTTTTEVTTTPGTTTTTEVTTTPGTTTTTEVTTTPGTTTTTEVTTTPGTTTTTEGTTTPGTTTTTEGTTTPGTTTTTEVTTTPGTTTTTEGTTPGTTTTTEGTTTPGTTTTTESTTTPGTTTTTKGTTTPQTTTTKGSTTHSSTTSKSTTTTSMVPSTTKKPGCPFEPHREHNETWMLCNCTMARCLENNTVEIVELKCEPPPMITCASGRPPIAVPDDDLCCWHWECDCVCTGWGDPHYVTFDGTYYSYQGNCTYALVEQIEERVDNFGVYIDNYDCGAQDRVSCPRNIIVRHESQIIRIVATSLTSLNLQVIVNGEIVGIPFKKYGVKVYKSGINYVVEIPELEANITYNGLAFSIKLPYRLFGHNTQGQCGTCTNNKTDDCLTRSGEIVSNCEIMADTWIVPDPRKPKCGQLRPTLPPKVTTPPAPCKPSPLCDLIKGPTFQACHKTIDPKDFYEACTYDSCHVPDSNIECSSLQHYALLCGDQGVCIEWRKEAPECSLSCPSHLVYNACGPALSRTCQTTPEEDALLIKEKRLVEGCFCPPGTMAFSPGSDVCVQTCGCVGPDNIPRQFGEVFELDCQDCVCREGGSGITCQKHECRPLQKVMCALEGFYPDIEISSSDACCNETVCTCDTSLCTSKSPNCGLGYEAVGGIPDGHCCPVYTCVQKQVCVHGNAEYLPGAPVFSDKCQSCVCSENANTTTGLEIKCTHVPCSKQCPLGFELKESPRDCCGVCEQTHCVLNQDGLQRIMKNGEIIRSQNDNCTLYSCTVIKKQFITSISQISCPYFNEDECEPDTIQLLPNGCCKICIEKRSSCGLQQYYDYLSHNNCRTTDMVKMSRCEGTCGTFSIYSAAARSMSHKCTCCQEVQTSQKHVTLQCTDGSQVDHEYIDVEKCSCVNTDCGPVKSIGEETPVRARRATKLRRKR